MQRHDFPLTRYIGDLIDCQMGKLSADDVRERWKAGNYAGVSKETASEYAELMGIIRGTRLGNEA